MLIFEPAMFAVFLAYSYGMIAKWCRTLRTKQIAMGVVMGAAAALAMVSPIEFAPGVIVDLRTLMVALSGAFFGIIGAAIAAIMAATVRFSIGGLGMLAGVSGIFLSAILSLVWARYVRPRIKSNALAHAVLGLMINFNLVSVVFMPTDIALGFLSSVGHWIVVFNIIGAIGFGALIRHAENEISIKTDLISAAATDPLTNLLNRRSVIDLFENLSTPSKPDRGTAMLCFDIDHFKQINDTQGHLSGDLVLLELKDRIAACLRPSDLFSRIGGDEFLIVLPNVNHEEMQIISERCRDAVDATPMMCDGEPVDVTISMGAKWTRQAGDFQSMFAETDRVLYEAKALGRNCVAISGMHNQAAMSQQAGLR
ncbi:GGDEF domain-containing protein [Yoonia sp. 208BN28-4]|uniref:GGDEF domain-containing protein n=1 Tax=Yoonia sp. 208BN28-4 TaxID=3126505 RepID=UPI0030B56028